MSKRFYWMKLKENFMTSDTVDFLMSQPNGAEYVVLYQMLCLQTLNTDGVLGRTIGEVMIPYDAAKIQRDCKYFSIDTVTLALGYYKKLGLVFELDNGFLKIANYENIIGSESGGRGGSNEGLPSAQAKSNAERQRAFRAKITCGQHQHVPSIDQHMNNKRYGGNYYIVMRRDNFKCTMCGSIENLCVHHIDGYNETKPENNAENKMLVLCRECHSQVHAGRQIPSNILEEIGYRVTQKRNVTDGCNVTSNVTVTTEIEKDIEKEIEIRDRELAKDIKEKLNRAGAYTGVHDKLVDEVVDTLCGLHEGQTLKFDGVTYSVEDFQQMAQLLEVEDVCRVVNRLLAHRNEIKNRKYYILATVAGVMRGEVRREHNGVSNQYF